MNEQQAQAIATALGGETWQSGGDTWLVTLRRDDGKMVVVSEDAVCLYADVEALESGNALQCIELTAGAVNPVPR